MVLCHVLIHRLEMCWVFQGWIFQCITVFSMVGMDLWALLNSFWLHLVYSAVLSFWHFSPFVCFHGYFLGGWEKSHHALQNVYMWTKELLKLIWNQTQYSRLLVIYVHISSKTSVTVIRLGYKILRVYWKTHKEALSCRNARS